MKLSRRTVLQSIAATGAAATSPGVFAPAIAQAKPIKIGYVTPQTGPLAAFGESDAFVLGESGNESGSSAYCEPPDSQSGQQ